MEGDKDRRNSLAVKGRSSSLPHIGRNPEPKILFFSGGTAHNSICPKIKQFTTNVAYIMPISGNARQMITKQDNGGSTREILRVIGGPAIGTIPLFFMICKGDIRSRLIRLASEESPEAVAVKQLLQHRLPVTEEIAKHDWNNIVEGTHSLWNEISEPYKETIRAFLVCTKSFIVLLYSRIKDILSHRSSSAKHKKVSFQ